MTLGDIVKEYRREHSMSMGEFAKKAGVSKAYISLLERNENEINPSIKTIKAVSEVVGKDYKDVIEAIEENHHEEVVERDVVYVYPQRAISCTAGDLELAISILEALLEKPDLMANTLKVHLMIEDVSKMYLKTFMLAAESMKRHLKEVEGLKVSEERTVRFF